MWNTKEAIFKNVVYQPIFGDSWLAFSVISGNKKLKAEIYNRFKNLKSEMFMYRSGLSHLVYFYFLILGPSILVALWWYLWATDVSCLWIIVSFSRHILCVCVCFLCASALSIVYLLISYKWLSLDCINWMAKSMCAQNVTLVCRSSCVVFQ